MPCRVKLCALAPSPVSLRALFRSSSVTVAKLVLPRLSPGAHWSHSSNITTNQLRGALCDRFGLASIVASSPVRNPKCIPISLHFAAWSFSWHNSNGRSLLVSCLVLFSSSAYDHNNIIIISIIPVPVHNVIVLDELYAHIAIATCIHKHTHQY